MKVKKLSALIYEKIPEPEIWKYEWHYLSSYLQTAIKSYWYFKDTIDVDKILKSRQTFADRMFELTQIVQSCRNLENVKLEGRYSHSTLVDLKSLIKVICDRPLIKNLNLCSMTLYKEELLDLSRCSMLEVLKLKIVVVDDILENIFKKCPKLHSISLIEQGFPPWDEKTVPRLRGSWLVTYPRNMRFINLLQTARPIPTDCLRRTLARSRYLEVLYLDKVRDGENLMDDLEIFVPFLTDLTLGACVNVDNFGVFLYLKRLSLLNVHQVDNNYWIKTIARNCPALEILTLAKVRSSMRGLPHIAEIRNLTTLRLDGHFEYAIETYTNYMNFLHTCTQLQYITIINLDLNDSAALRTIEYCLNLKFFEINGCLTGIDLILPAAQVVCEQASRPNGRTSSFKLKLYMNDFIDDENLSEDLEQIAEDLKKFDLFELDIMT